MNTQTQTIESPKKNYTSPRLINYGQVHSLTQSGTTAGTENAGNMMTFAPKPSDRMTKENIAMVGVHPLGFGLYLFDYKPEHRKKWGYGRQFGALAEEVESVMPEAVATHPDGYKMVNYALLGISHTVH